MPPSGLLPARFLFRYSLPVKYERKLPKSGKWPLALGPEYALPDFSPLEQAQPFGRLRLAWNQQGLGISVAVTGKTRAPEGNPSLPEASDGLRLFLDTRNTLNVHRATRFCQQFCLLPTRRGSSAADPSIVQMPILRAREEAPPVDVSKCRLRAEVSAQGYQIEAWLPAEVLPGFDPDEQPRLGFYYLLQDGELGQQYLSVGGDFPYAIDPSLWSTLELVSAS